MNRRSSVSSSTSAAMASSKRTEAMEVSAKFTAARAAQGKKRVALRDISKQSNVLRGTSSLVGAKGANINATRSISMVKKGSCTTYCDSRLSQTSSVLSATIKPNAIESSNKSSLPHSSVSKPAVVTWLVPCTALKSPNFSGDSVSSMSTCNSIQSPEFEYIDNGDSQATTSLERQANEDLNISEHVAVAESKSKSNSSMLMEVEVVGVDTNHNDPQFCTTLACDIYQNLQKAETKKRPSIDFMETIQKDITANMRSILIDWLVEVAEEYHLVPDTLYLSVNYLDRYLSGNEINRERLQLLGVACMLIAAKYEETCAPQVEDFCCMTDNTYSKDEVLRMESEVLNYLKFEMTVPTTKCFLRRFVHAAQGSNQLPLLQLEFLASYVAELSLLDYSMLRYASSLVASSAVFLAKFILQPAKKPWNATLSHYTLYKPSDLADCVEALHRLVCTSAGNSLPAIREKYSQHKYKFVAKKYCPASIPSEFFQDNFQDITAKVQELSSVSA
ncbi:cyclin-A1-4-like [Zingiber officinale]|uniref:cyclin-A1-4-like n=1 Tax=Zingiber officinale TaxID=94328 RepID=UPI001C4BAF3E|nr:cyclin-A1-4-like [Zingiber officinale]